MLQARQEDGKLIIALNGKIDSSNAPAFEAELKELCRVYPCSCVELDCDELQYITSAGLRVLLRFRQQVENTALTNVHTELYYIFDMTGFTEMMEVRRAYRVISVDGCEEIGRGANGKVYRIDPDTIVKVYLNSDALPEIQRSRELARLAFVAGVPTAIPYDVVRIDSGGYGSVFELLNAESYAQLLISGGKTLDETAEISVLLLKVIHSKEVHAEILPDMKAIALDWAAFLKDFLPAQEFEKLHALIDAVPEDAHLLHGDYHVKNVMLQNGESLIIDMDTLCHGHPIFELASMYNAYVGYGLEDPGKIKAFLGIACDVCAAFWRRSLALYLDTQEQCRLDEVEAKAKIIGLTRMIRREIRRDGLNREDGRRMIERCRSELSALLGQVDTLLF